MTPEQTKVLYDQYVNLQARLDVLKHDKQRLINSLLTPTQLTLIAEIEEEFDDTVKTGEAELKAATKRLKEAVVTSGASFNGQVFQIIYTKGRVKWDDRKLQDMVFDYPPLANARTVGIPYAVIRTRPVKTPKN